MQILNVEFNLNPNTSQPYRKPENELLYVNSKSNHPPSVLKQIPKGIAKRLSEISSSEEIFKNAVPEYQEALKKCGYDEELVYEKPDSIQSQRKKRTRQIIWFNPPYSANVKTNVGKIFLDLVRTHFHKYHKYHKIFNKNTVKISYSCMKNVATIIRGHNVSILKKEEPPAKKCNCPSGVVCPLNGECLEKNVIYEGRVKEVATAVERPYVGLTGNEWKKRRGVHNQCFNHRKHAKRCELSKHIWALKDSCKEYILSWKILHKVRGRFVAGTCKLCTAEKMHILRHPESDTLLNTNWIQKCVHERKYLLSFYTDGAVNDTMD